MTEEKINNNKEELEVLPSESFVLTPIKYSKEEYKDQTLLKHAGVKLFQKFQIDIQTEKKLLSIWAESLVDGEFSYHNLVLPHANEKTKAIGRRRCTFELSVKESFDRDNDQLIVNCIMDSNRHARFKFPASKFSSSYSKDSNPVKLSTKDVLTYVYTNNGYEYDFSSGMMRKDSHSWGTESYFVIKAKLYDTQEEANNYFRAHFPDTYNRNTKNKPWNGCPN